MTQKTVSWIQHLQNHICRSSRPQLFYKKGALKNFTMFSEKHLCHSLLFNKVATNSRNSHQKFSNFWVCLFLLYDQVPWICHMIRKIICIHNLVFKNILHEYFYSFCPRYDLTQKTVRAYNHMVYMVYCASIGLNMLKWWGTWVLFRGVFRTLSSIYDEAMTAFKR